MGSQTAWPGASFPGGSSASSPEREDLPLGTLGALRGHVDSVLKRLGETLLGKWHLDAVLGEGGMAAVYAATHRNGARGAVKMLRSSDPDVVSRFVREGYIANHVDHPAVVRALDDDVAEDGTPFLVMELLEGKSLADLAAARGGRIPVMQVLRVMREVLDALAAAHEHGIVHRDIKPENIFITVDGRVKVLDFGIAHLPDGCGPPSPKTLCGLVMGTPAFMSPEQARGRWDLVGPVSDVWAVGATMFTLLSGEVVHDEETVPELLAAIFTKPARSLREVMPNTALPVVALVDRALERRTADRWGSAREMRLALLEVEAALGKGDRFPAPSSVRATLPQGRRWPRPRRGAALAALDVSTGIVMLVLSVRSLSAGASPALPTARVAMADATHVTAPRSPIEVAPVMTGRTGERAPEDSSSGRTTAAVSAAARGIASSTPTTVIPTTAATSHVDGAPAHRNIYDRRH
jgi:serine/threonine-protein kinase